MRHCLPAGAIVTEPVPLGVDGAAAEPRATPPGLEVELLAGTPLTTTCRIGTWTNVTPTLISPDCGTVSEHVRSEAAGVHPVQPLTSGLWNDHALSNEVMLANSDVVTFHNYDTADKLETQIKTLQAMHRPLVCTEYMARTRRSLFETCLPVFKRNHVGALNWGLVKGKTNTIFAWDSPMPDRDEPPVWFHDIFRPNGTPFSQQEIDFMRNITGPASQSK